jgi:predicted 2-oxoglutarate/Fe(II)-dependent dioxygenase YbiX
VTGRHRLDGPPAPRPDGVRVGERVPDLLRHDASGRPWFLYDLFDGRPLLIAALPDPERAVIARCFDAFAASALAARARCVAIAGATPAALGAAGISADAERLALADDGAVLAWLLGSGRRGAALLLLDPNQRLLARTELDPTDPGAAIARLAATLGPPAPAPDAIVSAGAPALIVPRVLEPDACRELIALYRHEGGKPSGVLELKDGQARLKVDPAFKMRRDYQSFDAAWTAKLVAALRQRLLPEVDKCFGFRATTYEELKLTCYDAGEGGYHRPHRDNVTADVADRRFAMSLNLNTGEYEGGELRFPEYGSTLYLPPAGAAVVFSSSMLHEALPVTRGQRFVLLTFFSDDAARGPHLYHEPR